MLGSWVSPGLHEAARHAYSGLVEHGNAKMLCGAANGIARRSTDQRPALQTSGDQQPKR